MVMNQFNKKFEKTLKIGNESYRYYDIGTVPGLDVHRLPYVVRILLESILRKMDGYVYTQEQMEALASFGKEEGHGQIPFLPGRVILQDFTGVPAILDLASMGMAMEAKGKKNEIQPEVPVDLVIDHSLQVDYAGSSDAFEKNLKKEYTRNAERYEFLDWAEKSMSGVRIIPPANGIIHQINLEYLARVVMEGEEDGEKILYPDTLVGTDSHTTMINGLGILGWGVGGIEAEAGMLGQPSYIPFPRVVGVRLKGALQNGATATDAALTLTKMLRSYGVVDHLVEYFGEGYEALSLADRATIANMAPEYGATCGFFPVDEETIHYLHLTDRSPADIEKIEAYLKANHLFYKKGEERVYTVVLELDLSTVWPSLSGPKRPQDLIALKEMKDKFHESITTPAAKHGQGLTEEEWNKQADFELPNKEKVHLETGSVVIAAITSCTNTSNPSVMLAAGLLAKKAVEAGLKVPAHVKTSLTPGSRVVAEYLAASGLDRYLDQLGFQTVGYGCATCIGNSGPLQEDIQKAILDKELLVASVLSGNRNFEGRVHPVVKANYLASPPLVVAYALAGTVNIDFMAEPLGFSKTGTPVYFRDIMPTNQEIEVCVKTYVLPELFRKVYGEARAKAGEGTKKQLDAPMFSFKDTSTYIKNPPYFEEKEGETDPYQMLSNLRILAKFGDSVTTDHISPAGNIGRTTPAARYLLENGVAVEDFNTYGSRRGNHEVMVRGTFANIRIRNSLGQGREGGFTTLWPEGTLTSIYDAAMAYHEREIGLVVLAGKDYGMGSSRDWAAKGPALLGVRAVIAESYERIHRSNLVMMGVLPLQFPEGESANTIGLNGQEKISIAIDKEVRVGDKVWVTAEAPSGEKKTFQALVRFDSPIEKEYYLHGGILPMVLEKKLKVAANR